MKLSSHDLPKLWLPLATALAMISLGGLLAWTAHLDADTAQGERNAAVSAKMQIEQRLRQVRTEEQEIRERTQLLRQLQDSGISGEERRLDWMEMLRNVQRDLRIPGMNYEFGAQISLDKGDDTPYAWFSSPMRLQLRLLHEEDLLNFLAQVQKNAEALIIVRSCKLSPMTQQPDSRESMAQLAAECELLWLTTHLASHKK